MATIEGSAVFDQTSDAVWSVVSDLARFPDWFVMHEGFAADPPKTETGAKFGQRTRLLGVPAQISWTIESVEPGRNYTMVGAGTMGVKVKAETTVSAGDGETTVTIRLSFTGGIVTGPISATVEKEVTGKLNDSLVKLRAALSG